MSGINVKVAIGVGYYFAIVDSSEAKNIRLKQTNTLVNVEGETYMLYKGETFEESQKVDRLFDTGISTYPINDYIVKDNGEKEFDVTITRFGCVKVKASSIQDAIEKANALPTNEITWNEDWEATDAVAEE